MPLDKVKKTVLFSKGMSDDHDRFLVEPPALDRTVNLRAHKTGSLEKRPGFGPNELTTVPDSSGQPFFLHSIRDKLYTFTETGAKAYDSVEDSWSSIDFSGFVGTKETFCETSPIIGLGDPQFAQCSSNIGATGVETYAIAYDVAERASRGRSELGATVNDTSKHIMVAWFDANGDFVKQVRIDNAHSPQLVQLDYDTTGFAALIYQTDGGKLGRFVKVYGIDVAAVGPGLFDDVARPFLADNEQGYPIASSLWDGSPSLSGPRLGQGIQNQARFHATYNAGTDSIMCLAQWNFQLTIWELTVHGVSVNDTNVLEPGRKTGFAIDCSAGSETHVLYISWDVDGSEQYKVKFERYNAGLTRIQDVTLDGGSGNPSSSAYQTGAGAYTHGVLKSAFDDGGGNRSFIGYHRSGFTSWTDLTATTNQAHNYDNRYKFQRIKYLEYDYSMGGNYLQDAYGHRFTTNPVYRDGSFYVGVQQWADYTPHSQFIDDVNAFQLAPPARKPVTTSLCVADSNGLQPVAYIDAGKSQMCDYVESEMRTHLTSLYLDDDDNFLVANRVVHTSADFTYWVGGVGGSFQGRASNVELHSEALCRVHKIKTQISSGDELPVSKFGDGVIVGAAVPLWFDGKFFAEVSPLDSPEIVTVEDAKYQDEDGDTYGPLTTSYEPLANVGDDALGSQDWRKLVAVYGYTDQAGNMHRSAPSSTAYIYKMSGDKDDPFELYYGEEVTVYVTPPLTVMPADREYWLELYASTTVDTDPQLAAHTTIPSTGASSIVEVKLQLRRDHPEDFLSVRNIIRSSEPVYTVGGALAADPWPSFSKSVVASTRLWAIDSINKGRVLASKLFEDFISPEYNPTLAINLGDERDLTAIGKLDDKAIVFEPNDIHVIYGDGPDNRGQGQDFAVHYIATDVGCVDQESVIETPVGLIFYSRPRGFYLLDRNLQVQFIGGGIEDIADSSFIDQVISATLVPETAEVRFLVDGGTVASDEFGPDPDTTAVERPPRPRFVNRTPLGLAYVYNYEQNLWHMYGNYYGAAATIHQQKYTMLNTDWSIWQESDTRYDDPSGDNRSDMTTPWIKLGETVQDYHRLWRITFLGRYLSSLQAMGGGTYEAGDIEVLAWFDYENGEDAQFQRQRYRVQDFGFDPFNNPPKRAERLQFEFVPVRGRCQAIKLQIRELNSNDLGEGISYAQGHGFEISALDFHIGVSPMRSLIPQRSKK